MNYYYSVNGVEVNGPYTLGELSSYFATGVVTKNAQVCREGTEKWQPLSSVIDIGTARPTSAAIANEVAARQPTRPSRPLGTSTPMTKPCPMCGEQILPNAKKCKHCGEYLDSSLRPVASTQKPPSDTLGIFIMLFPLASTVLMWFWVGSMNLLQNPSSTLAGIVVVTVIATSALMSIEAGQLGMGGKRDGKDTTGPAGWFLCGLLLWIIGLPAYLYSRSKFGVKNYLVGGLLSVVVFLGVTLLLQLVIEQKKAEIRHNLNDTQEKLEELQRQFRKY